MSRPAAARCVHSMRVAGHRGFENSTMGMRKARPKAKRRLRKVKGGAYCSPTLVATYPEPHTATKYQASSAFMRGVDCRIPRMRQQIRFCTASDGVRLAYAVTGEGPPLVRSPHWFTHLEHDWTNPALSAWVEDLSKRYTLLRFDQRGTGLSDREVSDMTIEAHVRDLECVIDAAGFDRFALLGLSQGAAYAVAYAARHRERVTHLVICGGFVRGWAVRPGTPEALASREMQVKLIELGWGSDEPSFRQVFSTQFMPDAPVEAIRG